MPVSPGDHGAGRDLVFMAEGLHRAGVTQLLVREKHLGREGLVRLLRALAPRLRLIVHAGCADGEGLARAGGWGLHLAGGADVGAVRARFRGTLGYSAHSLADAVYAREAGADYVLLAPIWRPGSKPGDRRRILGVAAAAKAQKAAVIPLFALGGLTPARAGECAAAGIYGAAGIGGVFAEATPEGVEAAARVFLEAQGTARPAQTRLV